MKLAKLLPWWTHRSDERSADVAARLAEHADSMKRLTTTLETEIRELRQEAHLD